MINNFLTEYSPPAMDLKPEKRVFIWGIIISNIYSLLYYFTNYTDALRNLYEYIYGKRVLIENAVMPDFRSLLGYSFIGFWIVAAAMAGFIIYRYAYYRQGSMSIYLMKRLPQKYEIHKRALTLPIIVILLSLINAFVLLMIYYSVYMLATPKTCLSPDQWQILWRLF